ncbi:MAG: hypothetical protein EOO27_44815 [Comamonadaceae bacterium]|nr:MAG: hypothetical protein EOO27_44815 [Comamonadaceae bacterium]
MTTASMTPTASITTRPVRRPGAMSTAEIKSRIEAMFARGVRRRPGDADRGQGALAPLTGRSSCAPADPHRSHGVRAAESRDPLRANAGAMSCSPGGRKGHSTLWWHAHPRGTVTPTGRYADQRWRHG